MFNLRLEDIKPGYQVPVIAGIRRPALDFSGKLCNCWRCMYPQVVAIITRVHTS